jgi:hypothetical protein
MRSEAIQKDVSVNSLVTQIIKGHIDWHSNASKSGFTSVRREFITKLMEKLSEQEVIDIAKQVAKDETKGFVLMLRNKYDLESAMDVINSWVKTSGYSYRHESTSGIHSHVIQHDMGRKMSLSLSEMYRYVFQEFQLKKVDFDLDDNTISFVVDMRGDSS